MKLSIHLRTIVFLLSTSHPVVLASLAQKVECDVYGTDPFIYACEVKSVCTIFDLQLNKNATLLFTSPDDLKKGHIEFTDCLIQHFPKEIFGQFEKLEHVVLKEGKLQEIADLSFEDAKHLLSLNLADNLLHEITDKMFYGAVKLKYLDLGNNKIETVSPLTFHFLSNLEWLSLSYNKITAIPAELFAPLKNLHTIYMWDNSLSSVPLHPRCFWNNNQLTSVGLDSGNATEIELELQSANIRTFNIHGSYLMSLIIK